MNRLKTKKLNYLLAQWPVGVILTIHWLKAHGYYKQLIKLYCDNNWIKSLGRGAYARLNDEITWPGAVKALQSQLNIPVHVGGLTALRLHGISQYMMLNQHNQVFYLYNTTTEKIILPLWFQKYFVNGYFEQKKLFDANTGVSIKEVDGILLAISTPERAILETLALTPDEVTLSHVNELMESLDRLRSESMQQLLERCHSIKVKRLFLYLAERNGLSCFDDLKIDRLELGSGKRVIGKGGSYNAKWLLSLPEIDEFGRHLEGEDE